MCIGECVALVAPLELSETGRMLSTALSDGYLAMHHPELSPHHHQQLSASLDGRHFGQASDDTLFPPLTQNDRHPSAPQLVSMLTDNKADIMLHDEEVGIACAVIHTHAVQWESGLNIKLDVYCIMCI